MRKRLTILIWIFAVCAIGIGIFFLRELSGPRSYQVTQEDMLQHLKQMGRLNVTNPEPVLVPLDLNRPVRLALGSLGFPNDERNRHIQDLVLAELTGAPGLELVERQSLETVLQELNLSVSGFVRAGDAVRVGKLLKVDWFLLGTGAKIAGTNSIVLRIVDARTGILRDAGVFDIEKPESEISSTIAAFTRNSRQGAAAPKPRVFLAVGAFQDLSINRRQAAFPRQLRSYLTAAYRGTDVTLLEREAVDTLLQEVQLDLAGLTEGGSNAPQAMPSAYWLVNGAYQSYETTNFQVELVLNITRMFGRYQQLAFVGTPDETLFRDVKGAIDLQMKTNATISVPTRNSEARMHMMAGKELAHLDSTALIWPDNYQPLDATEAAKRRYNTEEAIRAFETVLLLEPTNREAKLCLAACLRKTRFDRIDEARNYYREILEDPLQDKWTQTARQALGFSFRWESPDQKARWYRSAIPQISNSPVAQYYREEAEAAEKESVVNNGGSQAREILERELLQKMTNAMLGTVYGSLGTDDFLDSFGTDKRAAARRLAELYPELKARAPDAAPYLLAAVVAAQVDTNVPVVAEFQKLLDDYTEHPDEVANSDKFWDHIWRPTCHWSFDHHLYPMAVAIMENKRRAIALAPHPVWQFDDEDKMTLAYAYQGVPAWRKALELFETYSNRPVRMGNGGPWGKAFSLVFTSKQAALCRQELGLPAAPNPLEFDMGEPQLCMCTPSTFIADNTGLWVGIEGQLVRLNFDLQTNLVVRLPMSPSTRVTTISLQASNVWIGTAGEGLIEYDPGTRQCRRFTMGDGLANDSVVSSGGQGNILWIGYATGLGLMDLSTKKVTTFAASIAGSAEKFGGDTKTKVSSSEPPRGGVAFISFGPPNEVFFSIVNSSLNRYRPGEQTWASMPTPQPGAVTGLDADANRLVVGHRFWHHDDTPGPIGVAVMNFKDQTWTAFKAIDGLPATSVTSVALDGDSVWVGGMGYLAVLDAAKGTVRHLAYVQTGGYDEGVDRIQIAGGYVWAQFNWHLYRAPLTGL